ncbi:MAG: FecCD family ABC transporter permease [Woeseiaceae bacterium]
MTARLSPTSLIAILLLISFGSLFCALAMGSDGLRFSLLAALWSEPDSPRDALILYDLRLPRALSAFAVGGLLTLCGILMQVLLRNPLADPYILGTSGGAACGALLAMLLGAAGAAVDSAAFIGASLATFIVFGIGGIRSRFAPTMLLLTGVVIATGFGALVSLMLALGDDATLRGMLFWLMGDFSLALNPAPVITVLLAATLLCWTTAPHLNVLAENETRAKLLGLPLLPARAIILLFASLLCAFAVTQAGSIGFVGLVVPHLVRRLTGMDHRRLIPAAVLAGGSLLCIADALSRTVLAPRQLPVGTLTAAIGVPLFLYLLSSNRRERH